MASWRAGICPRWWHCCCPPIPMTSSAGKYRLSAPSFLQKSVRRRLGEPASCGVRREEFRDALRRAAEITGDRDLVVIGSQAIHGAFTPGVLPGAAVASGEVDILPSDDAEGDKAWLLAGRGGSWDERAEIDGVDISTATLPEGWTDRLIPFALDDQPATVIGWCLDPHDLVVSKAIAGRDKDRRFIEALVGAKLVDPAVALDRMSSVDAGCRQPSVEELERAGVYLAALPRPDKLFRPASRKPPKGRARPSRDEFPAPLDMWADLRDETRCNGRESSAE